MTRAYMFTALALPLMACGSGEKPVAVNASADAVPDDYAARVAALPQGQRDGVLLRAIRDAGRDCQQVTHSEAIDSDGGVPAWAAICDARAAWVVALNPGGVATVTAATDIEKVPAD